MSELEHPAGAMLHIPFGKSISDELRAIARRERILLPLLILTAYVAVMSLWCNREDLVVGFPFNGRYRPELLDMVGWISYPLHLRIEVAKNDNLLDLLRRVSLEFHSAYDHQDFNRVPDLIHEFGTELIFNWNPVHWARSFADSHWERKDAEVSVQRIPLVRPRPAEFHPAFFDSAAGISGIVEYRPDLFAPSTIERFSRSLRLFAEELAYTPHTKIASMAMKLR